MSLERHPNFLCMSPSTSLLILSNAFVKSIPTVEDSSFVDTSSLDLSYGKNNVTCTAFRTEATLQLRKIFFGYV